METQLVGFSDAQTWARQTDFKALNKHLYLEVRCWNMICSDGAESQHPGGVCVRVHVRLCLKTAALTVAPYLQRCGPSFITSISSISEADSNVCPPM